MPSVRSPRTKREIKPSLVVLRSVYDDSELSLRGILDRDTLSAANADSLRSIITQVKEYWRRFINASVELIDALIRVGSLEDAQSLRSDRRDIRVEVRQFVDVNNCALSKLNEDILSNIDTASVCSETADLAENRSDLSHAITKQTSAPAFVRTPITTLVAPAEPSVKPKVCMAPVRSLQPLDTIYLDSLSNLNLTASRAQPVFTDNYHGKLVSTSNTLSTPTPAQLISSTDTILHTLPFSLPSSTVCQATSLPNPSSPHYGSPHTTKPPVDAATQHLVKQELFKQSTAPFDGDPRQYNSWYLLLQNRMKDVNLSPLDVITILLANTGGEPNSRIRDYLAAGAADPERTLQKIWSMLLKEYGASVKVCQAIQKNLDGIQNIRPPNVKIKLKDLVHACRIIEANMPTNTELQIFNLSSGQKKVWTKLPDYLQRKWRSRGFKYGLEMSGSVPPFIELVEFMQRSLDELTDPNYELQYERENRKTLSTEANNFSPTEVSCLYHRKPGHSLINCRSFIKLKYDQKQKFASENKLCFKCLGSHFARSCSANSKCSKCGRDHISVMHFDKRAGHSVSAETTETSNAPDEQSRNSLCGVICGTKNGSLSCSKTVLCEIFHEASPENVLKLYVIIDDMSSHSYVSEKVLDILNLSGTQSKYLLSTMESLRSEHTGTLVDGLWIRGTAKDKYYSLPKLTSSTFIPGSVYEVATPNIVKSIPHVSKFADRFLELDESCEPLLLLGRDAGDLMKCSYYGDRAPFVCETLLGYTLIGSPCSDKSDQQTRVRTSFRTVHEHYNSKPIFDKLNFADSKIFEQNLRAMK